MEKVSDTELVSLKNLKPTASSTSDTPTLTKRLEKDLGKRLNNLKIFWSKLGPGIVTGASDDDPSGIATYSQAGALFGYHTLWTSLFTLPLMTAIQEMCGRIGLVTGQGLTTIIKQNYPKWLSFLISFASMGAITLNIAANLAGMSAVLNLIFPIAQTWIYTILVAIIILISIILLPYSQIEKVLKWLSVVILIYLILPFFIKLDLGEVVHSIFVPNITFDKDFLAILVAILGTTISPYLFYWETSNEVEQHNLLTPKVHTSKSQRASKSLANLANDLKTMRKDNALGMLFSNLTMFFIMLATGTVLFKNNIQINTVEDAALALKPLAGEYAYLIFALGIIGTGFLSIPVLAGANGYILSELFSWKNGLDQKFSRAKGFYLTIAASIVVSILINLAGIDPIQSLIWAAIAYGVITPFIVAIILHISNSTKIIGKWKNGRLSNFFGIVTLLATSAAVLGLIYTNLF